MPELDAKDIPKALPDIIDDHLSALVIDAQILISTGTLLSTDMENHSRSSAIFASDVDKVTQLFLSPFFSAQDNVQMKFDSVPWVYKQGKVTDEDKLRPEILIHAEQHGKIMEVA
ncbi:unnamed protein product [Rhizopus stolonifer]